MTNKQTDFAPEVCQATVTVFSVVGHPLTSDIAPYLYDHTRVVARVEGFRTALSVLATSVQVGSFNPHRLTQVEHLRERRDQAEYLARYQADRLASGLYAARVLGSHEAAQEAVSAFVADQTDLTVRAFLAHYSH